MSKGERAAKPRAWGVGGDLAAVNAMGGVRKGMRPNVIRSCELGMAARLRLHEQSLAAHPPTTHPPNTPTVPPWNSGGLSNFEHLNLKPGDVRVVD
jgi:hypothetical protein